MKQCPNPDCIIYTRLDELPDTYTRCPQCGEELVDAPATLSTGRLGSGALPSDLTFPYKPPTNPAPQPRRSTAAPASHAPVTAAPNEYEDEYPAYGQFDFEDTDAEPLRT